MFRFEQLTEKIKISSQIFEYLCIDVSIDD